LFGVLSHLSEALRARVGVEWPNPGEGRGVNFRQAYIVANGLVTEIQHHDDRRSAVAAFSG
jgi:hypothetical protein